MNTVAKCAAIAGVVMLTAGSTAWAQTYTTTPSSQSYTTNPGTQGSYSGNQGSYYTGNQGTQGYQGTYSTSQGNTNQGNTNQGNTGQGSWGTGMQGSSTPYSSQTYSHAGYGSGNNITTFQQAEQELGRYGYSNVQGLRAMQGWSADAMKNGQKVHVILGDNGLVATFPGR